MNRKTAAYFHCRLREIVAREPEAEAEEIFEGGIEVDESDFGGRRKGRRALGTYLMAWALAAKLRKAKPGLHGYPIRSSSIVSQNFRNSEFPGISVSPNFESA